MGERNGSWQNFTDWAGTPTGPPVDSVTANTGSRSENETIGWKESVILKVLTAQQSNCTIWEYSVEAEATEGGHSVLTDVLASILMVISIISNVVVLAVTIYRIFWTKNKSAIPLFLLNLAFADILVSSLLLPLQAGWMRTEPWKAGEVACWMLGFATSFAYFLSGFVVVCISMDRCIVVYKPFLITDSVRRAKLMLWIAWLAAALCSVPEAVLHQVHTSPFDSHMMICTSGGSYLSVGTEFAHAIVKITLTGFPLAVIVICYLLILLKICRIQGDGIRRSSGSDLLARAQTRAFKLFIIIALAYLICWVPSHVIALWTLLDLESAAMMNPQVTMIIFLLSYASPCVNPFVYGYFHLKE